MTLSLLLQPPTGQLPADIAAFLAQADRPAIYVSMCAVLSYCLNPFVQPDAPCAVRLPLPNAEVRALAYRRLLRLIEANVRAGQPPHCSVSRDLSGKRFPEELIGHRELLERLSLIVFRMVALKGDVVSRVIYTSP